MELLIPVGYVENTAERIRLYRELDNIKDDEALQIFEKELMDRFGPIPDETIELFVAVKMRWLAQRLGLTKIILKNGKMFCYFLADGSSAYFNSPTFSGILSYVNQFPKKCQLSEQKEKLLLKIDPVKSIHSAFETLSKMINI